MSNLNTNHSNAIRDNEWISGVRGGHEQSLVNLIDSYSGPLRNYLVLTVHSYDVAEDIVQNLWIWLWENRTSLPAITNVKSYLYRAARNRALNTIRDGRTYDRLLDSAILDADRQISVNTGEINIETTNTRELLSEVINEFRPPTREICMLRFEQDMSYAEIAEVVGITEVNARMAVSRATKRLIERLKDVL